MASVYLDKGKVWRLQFVDARGKRGSLSLGKVTKRQAGEVLARVEELIAARRLGVAADAKALKWAMEAGRELQDRLAAYGLIDHVAGLTVGQLVDKYTSRKARLLKPSTRKRLALSIRSVSGELGQLAWLGEVDHATRELVQIDDDDVERGRELPASSVTTADAMLVRETMLARGLSEATVRKRCGDVRSAWGWGVKAKLLMENAWVEVPVSAVAREDLRHVGRELSMRIMDELPNAMWRAIWAVGRWQGVRVPSELRVMRVEDVVFGSGDEYGTMRVIDMKRTRPGKMVTRVVPIFPEAEAALGAWIAELDEGEELLFPWAVKAQGDSLRKPLVKAIRRAGVDVWPDLWRNVRSTRERELHDTHPADVATAWMGNSEAVAKRHYLRPTDEHFRRAVGLPTEVHAPQHARKAGAS
ncbi:MAG: hypothetical protein AAF078_12800 [Planctomycetota bacterium]